MNIDEHGLQEFLVFPPGLVMTCLDRGVQATAIVAFQMFTDFAKSLQIYQDHLRIACLQNDYRCGGRKPK
jgi:hypothetical protein